ncbi:MAG: HAD-IIA family hydrolase [Chloroflexota bacterium]
MLLLVDLDGVVYRGPVPVPGVAAVLTERQTAGDRVVYVTNNSRWHRTEYHEKLRSMGAPVGEGAVMSSARATALALAGRPERPRASLVLGGPGLVRELRDEGLRVVPPTRRGIAARPDAVVVGIDVALTYRRLSIAAEAVRDGALFVATNRDPVFPTAEGFNAGAGSIVAAVATAGRREPDLVIGKPEPGLFQEAARAASVAVEDAIVIGDGLTTDIAAANRVGARSILMLTGVTTRAQAEAAPAAQRPTWVVEDAAELRSVLEGLC